MAAARRWGNLTGVTNVCFVTFLLLPPALLIFPCSSLLGGGLTLAPKSVFLCCEVYVLLVPFAWGQALFSVEVLRVYPNVQDLGVSARLSESGGEDEERLLISHCYDETWVMITAIAAAINDS